MHKNNLWKKLLDIHNLYKGWHLSRVDSRQDFVEDVNSISCFADDLEENLKEIRHRIASGSYHPHSLLRIDVPKSYLGVRPGAVLVIEDRVVLYTIIYLIAPQIDKRLGSNVYSYRLKKNRRGKEVDSIFLETEIAEYPFLTKGFISSNIDPFEPWYGAWPIFDQKSREAFGEHEFPFLAVSDIAAYFENIQLPILRDDLLSLLPDDPKIVNLLTAFLEHWTIRTDSGSRQFRGIPQGTTISSFLGNMYLIRVDREINRWKRKKAVVYLRYMDDVRIFTRRKEDARQAIFTMDKVVRSLHLNVQASKTIILDENDGEISQALIDPRIDKLNIICKDLRSLAIDNKLTNKIESKYLKVLNDIAKEDPPKDGQRIIGNRKPLSGLSLRAFRRWMTAHSYLGSSLFLRRLIAEIHVNPDFRLTRRLVQAAQQFPRRKVIVQKLLPFLKSEYNIFDYQEAEIIRSFRYVSNVPDDVIRYCKKRMYDFSVHYYIRMQCAYLLARIQLSDNELKKIDQLFDRENDPYVKGALATILMQFDHQRNLQFIKKLVFHPNEKIRKIGKYYRNIKHDKDKAEKLVEFIFNDRLEVRICDYISHLYAMSVSSDEEIRKIVFGAVRRSRYNIVNVSLRANLHQIYHRSAIRAEDTPESHLSL